MRRVLGLVGWAALLGTAVVALQAPGTEVLAGPALSEPGTWLAWATSRPPEEALFALLRLGALGMAWYLLAVTVVGVAARLLKAPRLAALMDVVTLPVVRRVLQALLGASLAAGSLAVPAAPPARAQQGPPPTQITADDIVPSPTSEDAPWVARDVAQPQPPPAEPEPRPAEPEQPQQPEHDEWRVEAGQHFWAIAEQVLAEAWERTPSEEEVAPYWEALIEENRDTLADPGNPDLVYPGQVFRLPSLPAAGG